MEIKVIRTGLYSKTAKAVMENIHADGADKRVGSLHNRLYCLYSLFVECDGEITFKIDRDYYLSEKNWNGKSNAEILSYLAKLVGKFAKRQAVSWSSQLLCIRDHLAGVDVRAKYGARVVADAVGKPADPVETEMEAAWREEIAKINKEREDLFNQVGDEAESEIEHLKQEFKAEIRSVESRMVMKRSRIDKECEKKIQAVNRMFRKSA